MKTLYDRNQTMIVKRKACVDMTASAENLISKNKTTLFAEMDKLLVQVKELFDSVARPSFDSVETSLVRLETGQDWSLEGAVNLKLLRIQHTAHVCISNDLF